MTQKQIAKAKRNAFKVLAAIEDDRIDPKELDRLYDENYGDMCLTGMITLVRQAILRRVLRRMNTGATR